MRPEAQFNFCTRKKARMILISLVTSSLSTALRICSITSLSVSARPMFLRTHIKNIFVFGVEIYDSFSPGHSHPTGNTQFFPKKVPNTLPSTSSCDQITYLKWALTFLCLNATPTLGSLHYVLSLSLTVVYCHQAILGKNVHSPLHYRNPHCYFPQNWAGVSKWDGLILGFPEHSSGTCCAGQTSKPKSAVSATSSLIQTH